MCLLRIRKNTNVKLFLGIIITQANESTVVYKMLTHKKLMQFADLGQGQGGPSGIFKLLIALFVIMHVHHLFLGNV